MWGLATHPTRTEAVTVGDDCILRIWDVLRKAQKLSMELDCASRAVGYAPDGVRLCVGLGGRNMKQAHLQKDGGFLILDSRDLSIVHEGRDTKEWITEVRYTPDGTRLGAEAHARCYS